MGAATWDRGHVFSLASREQVDAGIELSEQPLAGHGGSFLRTPYVQNKLDSFYPGIGKMLGYEVPRE
jgi:hypothetical protein